MTIKTIQGYKLVKDKYGYYMKTPEGKSFVTSRLDGISTDKKAVKYFIKHIGK